MSLRFNSEKPTQALKAQWLQNQGFRVASERDLKELLMRCNAGLSPAEAYREMDDRSQVVANPIGEFASLARAQAVSKSVDLGRTAFDYRKASDKSGGQTSMSGQVGITSDKIAYTYAGTPIPIHDDAYRVEWREGLSMQAEGFDYQIDGMRESELQVMRSANTYYWDGNESVKAKDRVWLGFKADPSVLQTTTAVDFTNPATTAEDMVAEVIRLRDILRINNNCAEQLDLGVSREIYSIWEYLPYSINDRAFGTVLDKVKSLAGIADVYEEPQLSGGQQLAFTAFSQSGFHAVTGMAMATYMKQRLQHNDDWTWIKWMAQGFLSRVDAKGNKCAMYVQAA